MELVKRNELGYRIGSGHHRARLTDHEIEIFRRLLADGMRLTQAAAKMGISKGYASKLARFLCR